MSDVTYCRSEVESARPDWEKVFDCVEGESAVKRKRDTYLPRPNPTDKSAENTKRFEHYVERASFFNATGRTLTGMMGIAFREAPKIELPSGIEDLLYNADGAGTPLLTMAHDSLEQQMKAGRFGLYVDYPPTSGAVSRADQANVRPKLLQYPATNCINWRTGKDGRLSLVVLYETVDEAGDEFEPNLVDQWRELRLENGRYVVRVWRRDDETKKPEVIEEFSPLMANGRPWTEIPFIFAGAIDNNPNIDRAPLFDLACVNIAHYRNSADFEESVFMVGQPTLVISGLGDKDQVFIGSRAAIGIEQGGTAELLQAGPNTLAGEAMEKKEKQMLALGARLLTPGEAVKTAEQSRQEAAATHSPLSLACENLSMAYIQALEWASLFNDSSEPTVVFDVSADFAGLMADAQLIDSLMKAWHGGGLPTSDKNAAFRSLGLIAANKTDEEIADELEAEGGGLDLEDTEPEAA